jgi:hypothetical protein
MWSHDRRLRTEDKKALEKQAVADGLHVEVKVRPERYAKIAYDLVLKNLNGKPADQHVRRVARFLELCQQAQALHDGFRLYFRSHNAMVEFLRDKRVANFQGSKPFYSTRYKFATPEIEAHNRRLNNVLDELYKCTARYRWFPVVHHRGYEVSELAITDTWAAGQGADEDWENRAMQWLCARNGKWIRSIRRCRECSTWFFARAEHQQHCSNQCRQKFASHSEAFKQKRAEYMQDYRKREKERDIRARKAAAK